MVLTSEAGMPDEREITVAAFYADHNPVDREAYYSDKVAQIESGALTWAVRTFETDHGRVYDLFYGNVHRGFIDEEDGTYDAYTKHDDQSESLFIVTTNDLAEALEALETSVHSWEQN